ncbi:unnamed protein product [Dovyalis caffra]|uniref:Disease resistance protein At4g27190-like leucine-rich repeats domain-containing protein n=1 Tax=Dovyalis caffra TaxID=77055 RepID=A0AAV1RVA2_9ROSI|nr:unnamed protein product [Dovyalis caffra]
MNSESMSSDHYRAVFPIVSWRDDAMSAGAHASKTKAGNTPPLHALLLSLLKTGAGNFYHSECPKAEGLQLYSEKGKSQKARSPEFIDGSDGFSKEATIIRQGQFPVDILHKLKVLELQCFHEESAVFPFDLLIQRVHNLENLVVRHGLFKELFSSGLFGEEKHAMTLARIKCLKLVWLPNLERIWNQGLLVDQLIKNLEKLEAWRCYSLTNLAPSITSIQNLRSLDVWQCKGLKYLIASSTARSLVQLTAMTVRKCEVITEIVANEGDESESEIIFRKLESIRLDYFQDIYSTWDLTQNSSLGSNQKRDRK